jgi:hypothetical protein
MAIAIANFASTTSQIGAGTPFVNPKNMIDGSQASAASIAMLVGASKVVALGSAGMQLPDFSHLLTAPSSSSPRGGWACG